MGMLTLTLWERLDMQPPEFNEGEIVNINEESDLDEMMMMSQRK